MKVKHFSITRDTLEAHCFGSVKQIPQKCMYQNTPFILIPKESSFRFSQIDLTVLKVSSGWSWRPEVFWNHAVGTRQAVPVAS